jgi:hypothetical protein
MKLCLAYPVTKESRHKLVLPLGTSRIYIEDLPWMVANAILPISSVSYSKAKYANITKRHKNAIEKASLNGELIGRDPKTNVEQPFADEDRLWQLILPIEEVATYLSRYGIEVEIKQPPEVTGRYTLGKAAETIAKMANEVENTIYESLERAVLDGSLRVHPPDSKVNYQPNRVRYDWEEAYWDDLNKWLKVCHPRIEWSFPKPTDHKKTLDFDNHTEKPIDGSKKSKIEERAEIIGQAAKDKFDDPLKIPTGGKTELSDELCENKSKLFTPSTFDAAWKAAKKKGLVEMEDVEQFKNAK